MPELACQGAGECCRGKQPDCDADCNQAEGPAPLNCQLRLLARQGEELRAFPIGWPEAQFPDTSNARTIAAYILLKLIGVAWTGLALSLGGSAIGVFLILRRMSLMGDALAHSLLPGAAMGFLLGGLSLPAMSLGGFVAGIATAFVSAAVARFTAMREDASCLYDIRRRSILELAPPTGRAFQAPVRPATWTPSVHASRASSRCSRFINADPSI